MQKNKSVFFIHDMILDYSDDLIFSILGGVKFTFASQELKIATVIKPPFHLKEKSSLFVKLRQLGVANNIVCLRLNRL